MTELQSAIVLVSVFLVFTKFLDCWTTMRHIGHASLETNPIASWAMRRFGVGATIWGVFTIVLVIVTVVGVSAYHAATPSPGLSGAERALEEKAAWAFVTLGLFVAIVQASAAWTNTTGRFNLLTGAFVQLHRWMAKLLAKLG